MAPATDRVPPNLLSREVLEAEELCTFNWNTRDGWPMGATVSFLWTDGGFWFSMDKSEARIKAIRRDPRVAIVLRGPGKSVTIKGRCAITEDLERKRRVYREFGEKVARLSEGRFDADAYARHLEGKGSIVFEVIPEKWIAYDGNDGSVSVSPPE